MRWNWQQPQWPHFFYSTDQLPKLDRDFLQGAGGIVAVLKHFNEETKKQFIILKKDALPKCFGPPISK